MMLDFVDDECRRTDWGHLLLTLTTGSNGALNFSRINPLTLSTGDILLFLYMLIRQDGDFLIPYLHDLIRFADKPFSYLDAGENVPMVIDEILRRFRSAVYTGEDRERYEDLRLAQAKIQENIDRRVETMGSGSRREQTVLPRLEWLADIGVLCKQAGGIRSYWMSERGKLFCERIYADYVHFAEEGFPEEATVRLLDRRFFHLAHDLLYKEANLQAPGDVISFVAPGYARLKSSTGYCVGKTLLLLSHNLGWESGRPDTLEYDSARRSLEDAYQADPNRFYYTTARFGEDFQIRLEK